MVQEPKWAELGSPEAGQPAALAARVQANLSMAWALGTIPWTFALHLCLLSSLRLHVFLSYSTRDMLVNTLSLPGFKCAS